MTGFLSFLTATIVALLLRKYVASWKKHLPYPPGPKPIPIVGNILDLPTEDVPNIYIEWGKKYRSESKQIIFLVLPSPDRRVKGSILHASALGSHVVVVNKLEDAIELFERRARLYSDRPKYPILKL